MVGGKTGVDDAQEGGGHVGLDRLVEGRVEPSYRPLSTSPPRRTCSLLHSWWDEGELVIVACLVERLLVRGDGCLKDGLVGGDVGQAAVDSQGDVLYLDFLPFILWPSSPPRTKYLLSPPSSPSPFFLFSLLKKNRSTNRFFFFGIRIVYIVFAVIFLCYIY